MNKSILLRKSLLSIGYITSKVKPLYKMIIFLQNIYKQYS